MSGVRFGGGASARRKHWGMGAAQATGLAARLRTEAPTFPPFSYDCDGLGAKFNASLILMMRVEDAYGVCEKRTGKAARWLENSALCVVSAL